MFIICWLYCIVNIFVVITMKWFYCWFFIFITPEDNTALTSDFPRLTLLIRPAGLWSLSSLDASSYENLPYSVLGYDGQVSQKEEKAKTVRKLWSIITAFLQTSYILKCPHLVPALSSRLLTTLTLIIIMLTFAEDKFLLSGITYFYVMLLQSSSSPRSY